VAYSKIVLALVDNVRNHCEKFVNYNGGIVQTPIPHEFLSRRTCSQSVSSCVE
jgi:hypothetical protein